MQKYRKKPIVIEAMQFDGSYESAQRVVQWSGGGCSAQNGNGTLSVTTLEGTMTANPGDWIIKGVKGEFYPCKPDIFGATYELVQEVEVEWCDECPHAMHLHNPDGSCPCGINCSERRKAKKV